MAEAAGNGRGLPPLRPAAREVCTITTCAGPSCLHNNNKRVSNRCNTWLPVACPQAAERAVQGGQPDAPRGSPTHRFVRALLWDDPADVEHVDANPPPRGPAVVEVQQQRHVVQEVFGTGLKMVAVFGSAYALAQMAAPVINAFKRQAWIRPTAVIFALS